MAEEKKRKTQPIGTGMEPCKTALGKFLRARRLELGLSQIQVSERVGWGPTRYQHIEQGRESNKWIRRGTAERLATALSCDADALLTIGVPPLRWNPRTKLAQLVRKRCKDLGLSTDDLAQALSRPASWAWYLDTCVKSLYPNTADQLAVALGLSRSALDRFVTVPGESLELKTKSPLGRMIRDRCKELGLSANSLAKKIGVSRQRISQIVHKHAYIEDGVINRFADALDLDATALRAVRPEKKPTGRKSKRLKSPAGKPCGASSKRCPAKIPSDLIL